MDPEEEFEYFDSENNWQSVFQKLHATDIDRKHEYSLQDSKRAENRMRNRYRDVIPYDHSRVQLHKNGIDYINASLVMANQANRSYILTQGPLPDTAGHFWLMVWEQKSTAVVMLNRVIEKGQLKCHQYYPTGADSDGEDELVFSDVGLRVAFVEERESNHHYTARVLHLTDVTSCETRQIIQFHYTAWPDFGVPSSPSAFLDFLWAVRNSGALDGGSVGPPVIHCSAGVGRSGTFCLVDACLVLVERQGNSKGLCVRDLLLDMRRYRMGLVQTFDQLRFSYQAIIEGVKRIARVPSLDSGFENNSEHESSHKVFENGRSGRHRDRYSESDDTDFDNDEESDGSEPPPLPPRINRPGKSTALSNNSLDDMIAGSGQQCNGVKVPSPFDSIDYRANSRYADSWQMSDIRRRDCAERAKNSADQVARMKQNQLQKGISCASPPPPSGYSFQQYIIGAMVVVFLAIGSCSLYRYYVK